MKSNWMRLIAFTHYREKLVNLMTQQEKLSKGNRKNLNNHKINELRDNMKQSNKTYNWNAGKKGQNRKYLRKQWPEFLQFWWKLYIQGSRNLSEPQVWTWRKAHQDMWQSNYKKSLIRQISKACGNTGHIINFSVCESVSVVFLCFISANMSVLDLFW